MSQLRRLFPLLLLLLTGSAVPALADNAEGFALARAPGAIVIMRHALAPGVGDPQNFEIGDCDTQRNLDDRGRAQARAIGAAFRAEGIAFDEVLSSQWCRCRETAELLGLGEVEDLPALNSFFGNRDRSKPQTAELQEFLLGRLPGARIMLVTHQVNIRALTGRGTSSGEALVLQRGEAGEVRVVGSILIDP